MDIVDLEKFKSLFKLELSIQSEFVDVEAAVVAKSE